LLASLPRDHFDRLQPHLSTVSLQTGAVLSEAGGEVDQVCFSHYGRLSLLAVRRDGKAIETATVGREGVVGAMAGLGLYKSLVRVVVQMPMACSRIAATHFRTVVTASDAVRNLCIRYNEVLLSQARMTAACNALHPMEGAFAAGCCKARIASDIVALTQEFLAEMLGVRRTSITEVASKVWRSRLIAQRSGLALQFEFAALPVLVFGLAEALVTVLGASGLRTLPQGSAGALASGIFFNESW